MTARAVVVGGGFYGCQIAAYLARRCGGEGRTGAGGVVLVERASALMTRSSFANQARVHTGYHYPRSFTTAYRSRVNAPRFSAEFGAAVFAGFTKLYALARRNSKVTQRQMERFCQEIGAPLSPAPRDLAALFDPTLIGSVYLAEEAAFDAEALRAVMIDRLAAAGVEVRLDTEVEEVADDEAAVTVHGRRGGDPFTLHADMLFNCTYSRLQRVAGRDAPDFRLRHEVAEIVLVEPPAVLRDLGVTVMDGPFFSMMPFPARGLHSVSHVRYTPHSHWLEDAAVDPYAVLDDYAKHSRVERMLRDIARYLPAARHATPASSVFEVKTVLLKSEGDDSRPILLERHGRAGRLFSVLGGKIDNVYDILERLDQTALPATSAEIVH